MAGLGCWGSEHGDPSAAHVTRTRGRSCWAPLHGNLMFPFCTPVSRAAHSHIPAPGRTSHPADQWQEESPGRVLAALQVIYLISVTWAWDELGAPDVAISPGSEGGRRRRKQSSLVGELRVHRTEKHVQVQDNQDLSQWLSMLGHVAVSGDIFGYHDGGAPGIYWHRGMLFNFSSAQDSPPMTKDYPATNVSGVEAGKPCFGHIPSGRSFSFYFLSPRPFHHGSIR